MADRVVSVSIRAEVAGYLAGMEKVRAATAKTSDEAQKLEKQSAAFEKVGAGLLTIGAAAAAAVALAVKSFADFDAQMSQVQSLSHATAAEMDTLRNAALTMGQGIGFSATQVAEAETELVKAGVSVKDIMGGALKGALDLAAAGQIEVGRATEIASTALTQFGLSGKDVPHVADLLAAAADKSLGGVEELGQALQQSGLVANQFGLSIDETVGTLAEFASNGLLGSDAGTSFKSMLLQLATPSKQATAAMKEYNIQAYDAQGRFVGITGLAGQLAAGFEGVDDASRDAALGIIFGSDAIRAANILYKDGAKGNREWVNSVNEAGFAAQQAAGKTDNLQGDVKKLGAALETGLIKSGSASNDMLRTLVQNVTDAARAFSDAPSWVQGTALGLTALVAATALAGGGFLSIVPKVAAAKAAMVDLNLSGKALAAGLGKGGAAFLAVAALASAFSALGAQAQLTDEQVSKVNAALTANSSKALNQQFIGGGGAFDAFGKDAKSAKDALDGLTQGTGPVNVAFGKMFDGLTFGLTHVSDTSKRFEAQFRQIGTTLGATAGSDLESATKGFNSLVKQMGGGEDVAKRLLNQLGPYKAELIDLAGAQGETLSEQELLNLAQGKGHLAAQLAAESTQKQKEQLAELTGAASEADDTISELADAIRQFGSTQLSVEQTESDFQAAIDDATEALKENGVQFDKTSGSIDLNSEKGRANAAALRQIAQDGVAATAAIAENGGTQDEAAAKMQTTRDAYIKAAESFGYSKEQAVALADGLKLIPANVDTLFQNNAPAAGEKVSEYQKKLDALPKDKRTQVTAATEQAQSALSNVLHTLQSLNSKTLTITTINKRVDQAVSAGADRGAAGAAYRASGGAVRGPGTGTSDSIPAWLSNGEYVVKASSVRKYGTGFLDRVNAGRYATGGLVGIRTEQEKLASNRFKVAQSQQRAAQRRFDRAAAELKKADTAAEKRAAQAQVDAERARLVAAKRETANARTVARRAANALTKAKNTPTGADLGDRLSFRSSVREGSYDTSKGVSDLYSMGQDDSKYTARQRNAFLIYADRNEKAMLSLQKQSEKAADAVEAASDKLGDLKSAASSMASSVSGRLSDFSYGDYRSGSSLLRGMTSRAGKLKQFQSLLTALQKAGLAPALLNEVASLGVDQGLPLARSLSQMSKGQLSAINSQYNQIGKTSTAIGNQVADANYGKLIDAAEKQLSAANKNADKITKAINDQAKALQKFIGHVLGVPGYMVGGYTGNGSSSAVAGLVHGREFVVNAAATARNRGWLEAINSGGTVRYMDPTPIRSAAAGGGNTYEQHNHFQPVQNVDGPTLATVVGRETARAMAGMVS